MTNAVKIASTLEPHWRAPTTTHWMIILFVLIVKVQEFTSTNKKRIYISKGGQPQPHDKAMRSIDLT